MINHGDTPVSAFLVCFGNSYKQNCSQVMQTKATAGLLFENPCFFSQHVYIDLYALGMGIEMPGLIHSAIYKNT